MFLETVVSMGGGVRSATVLGLWVASSHGVPYLVNGRRPPGPLTTEPDRTVRSAHERIITMSNVATPAVTVFDAAAAVFEAPAVFV